MTSAAVTRNLAQIGRSALGTTMLLVDLQAHIANRTHDFDRFLTWRSREGRIVPAVRREAVQLQTSESYLYDDASPLFFGPTPCLRTIYADEFDVLCEEDSWLCLSPVYPWHVTMAQHLFKLRYAVCNIAKYGRTTQDVQDRKADPSGYLSKIKGAVKPKAMILSMGGNDFLGDPILSWLVQRDEEDHDPGNAPKYIDEYQFESIMSIARINYMRVIKDLESFSPRTTLLLQSYTYGAVPTHTSGAFLGRYFTVKGFNAIDRKHKPLIAAIIKLVIDRFHCLLCDLKTTTELKIEIVDFRKMLKPSDIRDEIHPKPSKAPAMAAKYVPFLKKAGVQPRRTSARVAAPRKSPASNKRNSVSLP